MATTKDQQFIFNNVGINDHIPYSKAEITKIGRVSDNFAFSFYQLDYQSMALRITSPSTVDAGVTVADDKDFLIPVGKIVLDRNGFDQFYEEIKQIKDAIDSEKKS